MPVSGPGGSAEAGHGFDAALARRPEYLPALMGAASVAVRQGDLDRALDLYRRAAASDPRRRGPESAWPR